MTFDEIPWHPREEQHYFDKWECKLPDGRWFYIEKWVRDSYAYDDELFCIGLFKSPDGWNTDGAVQWNTNELVARCVVHAVFNGEL